MRRGADTRPRLRRWRADRKDCCRRCRGCRLDAAPDMVAAARARGIDARIISGESLTFNREFDAVFSNAALHWMHPPDAVLAGVRRALKPRGRFVGEMGGHNNTAAIIVALSAVLGRRGLDAHRLSPWYFPSVAAYRAKLEGAASRLRTLTSSRGRRHCRARSSRGWTPLARLFSAPCRKRTAHPRAPRWPTCWRRVLVDETGTWIADYVRLRFRAMLAG